MVAQPSLSQVADSGPSGILAAAYDRLPVAMLCVRDKSILYANGAAATLFGTTVSAMKGLDWASLLKPEAPHTLGLEQITSSDPLKTLNIAHAGSDMRGALYDVSAFPAPTGRAGEWLLCLRPLEPGGCVLAPSDDQEAILAHLLEAVGDAVLVVGNDGRIIDLNKGAQRVFAVDREPARGMSIWPLLAPTLFEGDDTLPEASVQMLIRAVPRSTLGTGRSMTLSRADGISFPGEIAITPLPLPGCSAHLITVRDVSDRKRIESRLERLALYDPLTRLPNRVKVLQHLERLVAQAPLGTIVAVAIDVDHFKYVNDFFGHGPGDRLLQAIGGRLGGDLEEGDLLGHLGGDDFLIVSATNDPIATIERLARRVEEASARTFLIDQSELFISLSQGIALYPDHATDPSNLLTAAQAAT